MKTLLGLLCALNLLAGGIAFINGSSPEVAVACLGGALVAGTGCAILDRLDKLRETGEKLGLVLTQIRDEARPKPPAALP